LSSLSETWGRSSWRVSGRDGAKELLNSEEPLNSVRMGVSLLTNALNRAIDLKLYSLDIAPDTDLFSKIERLVEAGIDTRSLAWREFVMMRGFDAHSKGEPSLADLKRLGRRDWRRGRKGYDAGRRLAARRVAARARFRPSSSRISGRKASMASRRSAPRKSYLQTCT